MSQEKVNPRLIKSNIDLLTKIVKRPAVNEKILSRPPFRFIFDLTTMIIKTTGYLRGLYTEDEFNFEMINSNKESKMAFLDKLIDVIGFINSKPIDVKSAKIVAGVEVEKTNKLLNEFAKIVLDKKPFLESVEKVRKGLKPDNSGTTETATTNNATMKKNKVSNVNDNKSNNKNNQNPANKSSGQQKPKVSEIKSKKTTDLATKSKAAAGRAIKNDIKQKESKESIEQTTRNNIQKDQPVEDDNNNKDAVVGNYDDDVMTEKEESESILLGNNNGNVRRPSTTTKQSIQQQEHTNDNEQMLSKNSNNDILQQNITTTNDNPTFNDFNQELSLVSSSSSEAIENNNNSDSNNNRKHDDSLLPLSENDNSSASVMTKAKENNTDNNSTIPDNESSYNSKIGYTDAQENFDDLIDKQQQQPEFMLSNDKSIENSSFVQNRNNQVNDTNQQFKSNHHQMNKTKTSNADLQNGNMDNVVPSSPVVDVPNKQNRLKSSSTRMSARPKSSRPAPPRVMTASRSRLSQLMETRTEQFGENTATNATNVWIPDSMKDDDDNDEFVINSQKLQDSFLIMDSNQKPNETEQLSGIKSTTNDDSGHLVQQLMATKSELEGQIKDNLIDDQLMPSINDKPINDTNQIRNQIQALSQSIRTLTKAMGYLHEDVRPMLDELKKWQDEYESNNKLIEKISSEMNKDLEPVKKELTQIEHQVDDYVEQIRSTKANVYRNEQLISKLIDSV